MGILESLVLFSVHFSSSPQALPLGMDFAHVKVKMIWIGGRDEKISVVLFDRVDDFCLL
jgi:hypothetical protein